MHARLAMNNALSTRLPRLPAALPGLEVRAAHEARALQAELVRPIWSKPHAAAKRIALKLRRAEERFISQSTRAASFKRLLGSRATGRE